jgi:predicted ArsR family transcriptional regulator
MQTIPAEAPSRARSGTRDRVARSLLESGPQTAAALAAGLGVSPAAIRRHLDALLERDFVSEAEARTATIRGRGRPARIYALTDVGRAEFPHAYDDLASTALRFLYSAGGSGAVESFAGFRTGELEHRLRRTMADSANAEQGDDLDVGSPERLARALTAEGYAASVHRSATGVQLCQHHCPVAHVAAQFGQICEAETRMFERLLGTHVQRLATIAHGDGVCTTFVPDSHTPEIHTPDSHTPDIQTPDSYTPDSPTSDTRISLSATPDPYPAATLASSSLDQAPADPTGSAVRPGGTR